MPRLTANYNADAAIKRVKLEQESLKLAQLKNKAAQEKKLTEPPKHTPYDQIPPPNDEEMRGVQDRLNALYNKIRKSQEEDYRNWLLSFADDWP